MEEKEHIIYKPKKKQKEYYKKDEAVKCIINDILRGATQSILIDKLMNDYYELDYHPSEHTCRNIISSCRKKMKDDWEAERKELREIQMNRLLDLYTTSLDMGDRFTALNTLKEINKVTGLYEPIKIEQKIDNEVTINFDF